MSSAGATMRASERWQAYWNVQDAVDDAYWERHIRHFLRQSGEVFPCLPEDVVLDIGAGTGHFARALAPVVSEVHCLESSQRYVEACRERLAGMENAFVHEVPPGRPETYEHLGKRFTRINCLSVIQYFDATDDFEAMLRALKPVAAPGALLLVGDIRVRGSMLSDLAGSIAGGLAHGLFAQKLRLLWRMMRSGYGGARAARLLDYREDELLEAVRAQGLSAEFIRHPLTMNTTRRHLLVRFPGTTDAIS